jgi:uncharacterized membrane protein
MAGMFAVSRKTKTTVIQESLPVAPAAISSASEDPIISPARVKCAAEKLHAHIMLERGWIDRVADFLTVQFGTVWFLLWNAVLFAGWIEWNLGWFGFAPFDPFPFGLLTMIVSLEAIMLAIIVLISQNRQNKLADMRQRVDLEIDVRAESEITKILRMLHTVSTHLGITQGTDRELKRMERSINVTEIQREIEDEVI